MIAVGPCECAHLESDQRWLDVRQNHRAQTLRTDVWLDRCADWIKRDLRGWHDTHLDLSGSATELSVTGGRCRYGSVIEPMCASGFQSRWSIPLTIQKNFDVFSQPETVMSADAQSEPDGLEIAADQAIAALTPAHEDDCQASRPNGELRQYRCDILQ